MEHADYARVKAFQEQSGTRKELIVKADFSYDQSYDKALDAAFRQWRFLTLPPDKLAILRTPNAFEVATQSITKEDIARDVKIITSAQETLNAWLKIGEQCEKWQDDCLDQAKKQKLERLPLNFSYHPVGIDTSNQITSRADQRLYDEILQRLEWEEVVPQLQ